MSADVPRDAGGGAAGRPSQLSRCFFAIDRTANPCPAFNAEVSASIAAAVASEFAGVSVSLEDVDRRLRVALLGSEADVLAARGRIYDIVLSRVSLTFFLPEECAPDDALKRAADSVPGCSVDGVLRGPRFLGQASVTVTAPVESIEALKAALVSHGCAASGWSFEPVEVPREHVPSLVADGELVHGIEQGFRVAALCPWPPSGRGSVILFGRQRDAVAAAANALRDGVAAIAAATTTLSVVVPQGQLRGLVSERERRVHAIAMATSTYLAVPAPSASGGTDIVAITGKMDACLRATSLLLEAAKGANTRAEVPSEHTFQPFDAAGVAARTGACLLQPIVAIANGSVHVNDPSRPVIIVGDSACVEPAVNAIDRRMATSASPLPVPSVPVAYAPVHFGQPLVYDGARGVAPAYGVSPLAAGRMPSDGGRRGLRSVSMDADVSALRAYARPFQPGSHLGLALSAPAEGLVPFGAGGSTAYARTISLPPQAEYEQGEAGVPVSPRERSNSDASYGPSSLNSSTRSDLGVDDPGHVTVEEGPDGRVEMHFRVDRHRLEYLLRDHPDVLAGCAAIFGGIMAATGTQIRLPPKLKVGARSKKNPTVMIAGEREAAAAARLEVLRLLDTEAAKVTAKVEIAADSHSDVIGKGGCNVRAIMTQTHTHIHFPDSHRARNPMRGTQVTISGHPSRVDEARHMLRQCLPLCVSYVVPATAQRVDDRSPAVRAIAATFCVSIAVKRWMGPPPTAQQVFVRGMEGRSEAIRDACTRLMELFGTSIGLVAVSVSIPPDQQLYVRGEGDGGVKMIARRTITSIHFPSNAAALPVPMHAGPHAPPIEAVVIGPPADSAQMAAVVSTQQQLLYHLSQQQQYRPSSEVTIVGTFHGAMAARRELLDALPFVLMFEVAEDVVVDQGFVRSVIAECGVHVVVKLSRQHTQTITVRCPERHAAAAFAAREQLVAHIEAQSTPATPRVSAGEIERPPSSSERRGPHRQLSMSEDAHPTYPHSHAHSHAPHTPSMVQAPALPLQPQTPQRDRGVHGDSDDDPLTRTFGRGSASLKSDELSSPISKTPSRTSIPPAEGESGSEPFSMFSRANSVADTLGHSLGHIPSRELSLERTPQQAPTVAQLTAPQQRSGKSPTGSSESVAGSTGSGSGGKQGEYSLWRSDDVAGDMFSQSWPLARHAAAAEKAPPPPASGRSSGLGSRPSSRASHTDALKEGQRSLNSSSNGAGVRMSSLDSGMDVGDPPSLHVDPVPAAVPEAREERRVVVTEAVVGEEALELEYLNEMADAIAAGEASDANSKQGAVSLTSSALVAQDSGTVEDDEGYGQRQRIAEMVMRKSVNFDKVHEPTGTWSGLGFSKSTPEGTLRDLLREHSAAQSSPSISDTSLSRRDSIQSHADSVCPDSTDDDTPRTSCCDAVREAEEDKDAHADKGRRDSPVTTTPCTPASAQQAQATAPSKSPSMVPSQQPQQHTAQPQTPQSAQSPLAQQSQGTASHAPQQHTQPAQHADASSASSTTASRLPSLDPSPRHAPPQPPFAHHPADYGAYVASGAPAMRSPKMSPAMAVHGPMPPQHVPLYPSMYPVPMQQPYVGTPPSPHLLVNPYAMPQHMAPRTSGSPVGSAPAPFAFHTPQSSPAKAIPGALFSSPAVQGRVSVSPSASSPTAIGAGSHCKDLDTLLASAGLSQYAEMFATQEVDLATFLALSEDDLKDLGVAALGARRRMLAAANKISREAGGEHQGAVHSPATSPVPPATQQHAPAPAPHQKH